ncbi:MAG: AurF N-oxygenase family protein [Candidatus Limnocylindrales bacterium]
MTATALAGLALDEEQEDDRFTALLGRLSRQSVLKHFDAYADVDWDHPANAIDPHDPRWELDSGSGLAGTDWYRSLPAETRARIGLHGITSNMKAGLQFENVLKRGLLEYAFRLPDGSPEFRYVYHEVIEEAQHSLMFQEFVNRTGLETPGLPWELRVGSRNVVGLARRFPALFFVFVLGGEDPIDHVQRTVLRSGKDIHPLLERIMRIHVTEEARHLSFARGYLRTNVPKLPAWRRRAMAMQAPLILATEASVMLRPPRHLVRTYGVPDAVLRQAYGPGSQNRQDAKDALRKVRNLLVELGLVTPAAKRLWQRLGIWDDA